MVVTHAVQCAVGPKSIGAINGVCAMGVYWKLIPPYDDMVTGVATSKLLPDVMPGIFPEFVGNAKDSCGVTESAKESRHSRVRTERNPNKCERIQQVLFLNT